MNKLIAWLPPRLQALALDYAALVFGAFVVLSAAIVFFVVTSPEKHSHGGYVPVQTVSTFDTTSDSGFSYRAVVRLPDGTLVTVSTSSLAAVQWFVKDTCVEQRKTESGGVFYRLAAPAKCLP